MSMKWQSLIGLMCSAPLRILEICGNACIGELSKLQKNALEMPKVKEWFCCRRETGKFQEVTLPDLLENKEQCRVLSHKARAFQRIAVWQSSTIAPDWKRRLVVPIWKRRGNSLDCLVWNLVTGLGLRCYGLTQHKYTYSVVDTCAGEQRFGSSSLVFPSLLYGWDTDTK